GLEPEVERVALLEAVATLLSAVSARAPTLPVLDDLHWATRPTLVVLRHLVRAPQPMRLLVVAAYRETEIDHSQPLAETLAELRRDPQVERVRLVGLTAEEISTLVDDAATRVTGATLPHDARDLLGRLVHEQTQGNPLFVTEVLRHLADGGAFADPTHTTPASVE